MAIDLAVMRKRLEDKQAELQQHITTLTGSPTQSEDAIQASDGVVEPEEEAVDLEETDVEQGIWTMRKRCSSKYNRRWLASIMGRMVSASIAGSQSPKKGWRLFLGPDCV